MSPSQRSTIYDLLETFNIYLPAPTRAARMERLRECEDQTYFAWIGGWGLGDAYYYRIHGPMTFCEVGSWDRSDLCCVLCVVADTWVDCSSNSLISTAVVSSEYRFQIVSFRIKLTLFTLSVHSLFDKHVSCQVSYPYGQPFAQLRGLWESSDCSISS
jgi:hypothetical protein